jgi:hypothetical protein
MSGVQFHGVQFDNTLPGWVRVIPRAAVSLVVPGQPALRASIHVHTVMLPLHQVMLAAALLCTAPRPTSACLESCAAASTCSAASAAVLVVVCLAHLC